MPRRHKNNPQVPPTWMAWTFPSFTYRGPGLVSFQRPFPSLSVFLAAFMISRRTRGCLFPERSGFDSFFPPRSPFFLPAIFVVSPHSRRQSFLTPSAAGTYQVLIIAPSNRRQVVYCAVPQRSSHPPESHLSQLDSPTMRCTLSLRFVGQADFLLTLPVTASARPPHTLAVEHSSPLPPNEKGALPRSTPRNPFFA